MSDAGDATSNAAPAASIDFEDAGDALRVRIAGRLDAAALGRFWESAAARVRASRARRAAIDVAKVGYLDGSGLGLVVGLDLVARERGMEVAIEGAEGDRRLLIEMALRGQDSPPPARRPGIVEQVGEGTVDAWRFLVDTVRFRGELTLALLDVVRHPRHLRLADTMREMATVGANALPVVSLLGFLIGAIIAFQTMDPMARYGAKLQVADVVGVSVVRELGPLITAILVAGRSGAAFAATIGTMKVAQEIDALRTFGIPPMRFLVVPRFIACVTMTPLLAIFANVMGIAGGWLIMSGEGFTFRQYLVEVQGSVDAAGFAQGLVKAAVFGSLIAGIGCERGMRTPKEEGARAVGDSTTRAVVASIIMIIVADAVLGTFFYTIGI